MFLRFEEAIKLLAKFQLLISLHTLDLKHPLLMIHDHLELGHRGVLRGPGQFITSDSSWCRIQYSLHDQRLRRWRLINIVRMILGFIDWRACYLIWWATRFSVRQCLFTTWLDRLIESKLLALRQWLSCRRAVALISQFNCVGEPARVLSHFNLCFTFFYLLANRYCELINPHGRDLALAGRSTFLHSGLTFNLNFFIEVSLDRPLTFILLKSNRLYKALQPEILASGWYLPFYISSAVATIVLLLLKFFFF